VVAHEQYHSDNELPLLEEEANAEAKAMEVVGEMYLVALLCECFNEMIKEDQSLWLGRDYKFKDYGAHTQIYKNVTQASKNIIRDD